MSQRIKVDYGKKGVWLDLPNEVFVVGRTQIEPLKNREKVLINSFRNPIGSVPLQKLAVRKKNACVVISDNTRPVPNEFILNGIISEIMNFVGNIRILIANGIHKKLDHEDIEELVGKSIASNFEVINHDAFDLKNLQYIGKTERAIPIYINKHYLESDLRILTGLIEPHFMAGYSGGRKSICPGIAGYETVKYFHGPALLESSKSDNCIIDGNPVHEEAMFMARKVGVDFIVNVTLDFEKNVTGVFSGDLEKAWYEGVKFASSYLEYPVEREYKVVITSNGGYPLDRNYYQTVKGLVAASRLVEKNGVIIVLSECIDGLGSENFKLNLEMLKSMGMDKYISYISKIENFTVDQWEVEELVKVLRKTSRIFMYSEGLSDDEFELTFAERVKKEDIVEIIKEFSNGFENVAIMPYGPYAIPILKSYK